MKFGVRLAVQGEMGAPGAGFDYAKTMTLEAEALGFDSAWLPDHVINAHMQKKTPMLECWTVLSALAVLTTRIRLAGHTFNNSLRNPAVLAKMAATLDVVSGGRLIYSLGSAWFKQETSSYGLPFDDHDTRVERLRGSGDPGTRRPHVARRAAGPRAPAARGRRRHRRDFWSPAGECLSESRHHLAREVAHALERRNRLDDEVLDTGGLVSADAVDAAWGEPQRFSSSTSCGVGGLAKRCSRSFA